ncbi:hypothetical protein P280DRAFT_538745, partial [Massarina eburnea CBS 473.64]
VLPLWESYFYVSGTKSNRIYVKCPFRAAIRNGHTFMVPKMLVAGMIPSAGALKQALLKRQFDIADSILNILSGCIDNSKSLHYAVLVGAEGIIRTLVATSIGIHQDFTELEIQKRYYGTSLIPLHRFRVRTPVLSTAILSENQKIVSLMLSFDILLDPGNTSLERDTDYISPLTAAVHVGNLNMVTELIARGVNPCDNRAIFEACCTGNHEIARAILDAIEAKNQGRQGRGSGFGARAIREAIEKGDIDMVDALAPIADMDQAVCGELENEKALLTAVCAAIFSRSPRRLDMIEILFRHGANANQTSESNYHWLSHDGLFGGPSNITPLIMAITTANMAIIQCFLCVLIPTPSEYCL